MRIQILRWLPSTAALLLLALAPAMRLSAAQAGTPQAQTVAPDLGEIDEINVAPVVIDGVTMLRVYGITAFPAGKRAAQIAARIEAIAEDPAIPAEAVRVEEAGDVSKLVAGHQLIMQVTEPDARLEQTDRRSVARAYALRISEAIRDYRRDRTPDALTGSAIRVLAATATLAVLLWLGWRMVHWLDGVLERRVKGRLAGIEAHTLRMLSAAHVWRTLRALRSLLWTVIVLVAIVSYLNFSLQQFPWTRAFGLSLYALLTAPLRAVGHNLLAAIPDLLFLAILFVAFRYVLKSLHLLFAGLAEGAVSLAAFDPEWAWPTYRLVRLLVLALALVVAYPYIPGSQTDAFKGISIFLGVIFSLGSSSLIGNIIAGYSMTYRRAFRIGDRVRVNDHTGEVIEMRLLVTHLRTPKNEEIVIPNSEILNSAVVNYSTFARQGKLIIHTTVGIGYESPWRQVEAILLQAAARTEGVLAEPRPFVLQRALGDFAVTYEINAYCAEAERMLRIQANLHQNILDVFNEYGIQIMTPAYEGDPEEPKVVPRDRWYAPPAAPAPPPGPNAV